jgi:hypothetical protein
LLNMLMLRTSYSKALCFNVSKWKFLLCQSTCELCKGSQDNSMMIEFF